MKRLLFVSAVMLALSGCSDPNGAKEALEDTGYTKIETTGYAFFGCGRDDTVHTGFVANAPGGRRVEGVVCAGWSWFGKSSTIRITGRV